MTPLLQQSREDPIDVGSALTLAMNLGSEAVTRLPQDGDAVNNGDSLYVLW